jgi:aminopeptidase N
LAIRDDAFFALLREWATTHRHRTVTTEEFVATARRHATRPLDKLFRAWLHETRLPALPTREGP